jgi:hypothetical protein
MTRSARERIAGAALLATMFAFGGAAQATEQYVAELVPLNGAALDQATSRTATFAIDNGRLTITIAVDGLAPGIMHMQHFHGIPGGGDASCPTVQADSNGDGFIDLVETEPVAGATMVPLHDDPARLEIANGRYPVANEAGAVRYQRTVSVHKLRLAVADKFGAPGLDLDKWVVFLHGIAPDAALPASVRSLPGVPAQMTLPVACGVVERLE